MKHYVLSFLTCIVIAVLSLFPVNELHLENLTLGDKWAHALMYGGLTAVMIFDRNFKRPNFSLPLWLVAFPVLYGGIMELLQAYCTNGNRSGDWLDLIADTLGSILVYAITWLVVLLLKNK